MSFASGADHQASSAIVSKQTLMSKIYTQSHFVHMLHNTPDSSNSEELIMFLRQNFIQIGVNGTLTKTNENKLIQLKYRYLVVKSTVDITYLRLERN